MNNIHIKLSSNYQQIEFDVDDINEDITSAVKLINELGRTVNNSDSDAPEKKPGKKTVDADEPASERQIDILKKFHVKDAEKYTRSTAWAKIRELKAK